MVGSQELPVPRRCWCNWGLVVSLNNLGFGKNNLVPTVTVSFDALEAGDTAEGLFDFVLPWKPNRSGSRMSLRKSKECFSDTESQRCR